MRILVSVLAVLAALALPSAVEAGCAPAHTAQQSTPPATTAAAPQSTPAPTQPGQDG